MSRAYLTQASPDKRPAINFESLFINYAPRHEGEVGRRCRSVSPRQHSKRPTSSTVY